MERGSNGSGGGLACLYHYSLDGVCHFFRVFWGASKGAVVETWAWKGPTCIVCGDRHCRWAILRATS